MGEKHGHVLIEALGTVPGREPRRDLGASPSIGDGLAVLKRLGRRAQRARVERAIRARSGDDAVRRLARCDVKAAAERRAKRGEPVLERAVQPCALIDQRLHQLVERRLAGDGRHLGERNGEIAVGAEPRLDQHPVARVEQRLGGVALVHHLEMRRDPGLDRKAPQQRLAEGVDRLDLHAARRIEHAGEEGPRARKQRFVGRSLHQALQVLREPAVRQRGPVLEALMQAVRHLGRGGAGKGEAQDARRIAAAEQQAQHAVGQDLGLAASGRGRDPNRGVA